MEGLPRQKKIGLMGPFGYGNLGDAAIQEAMIQHIRSRFPGAEICGYSLNPEDTQLRHGIRSFPISRISWAGREPDKNPSSLTERVVRRLRSSSRPSIRRLERWVVRVPIEFQLTVNTFKALEGLDVLIISGGGQLDDYWGGGGPWSHPYTMLKWGALAKLRRAKFFFVSVGAGPIDARLSKLFIRWALSLAGYRSFRDQFSKRLVESIGFRRADPVYPDLALSLKIAYEEPPCKLAEARPVIGIGPIGYFKQGCWPEHDEVIYSDYLSKMASFVAWLINKQYSILFLPGEAYFDLLAIDDLKKAVQDQGISFEDRSLVNAQILTVDDLIRNISLVDMVVASRFHNVLLGQLMGKPVLALSYQAKIEALMADTGQAEYCFPVGSFDLNCLKERFISLEADSEKVKIQVAGRVKTYQAALEEQYERIFNLL